MLSNVSKKFNLSFIPLALLGVVTLYFATTKIFLPLVSSGRNVEQIGGRSYLWQTIFEHWDDKGFLGQGPGTLRPFMYTNLGISEYGHAHNSALQYLWDFGVIGIIVFLLFQVSWIISVNSRKQDGLNDMCILLVLLSIQTELSLVIELSYKGIFGLLFLLAIFVHGPTRVKGNYNSESERI